MVHTSIVSISTISHGRTTIPKNVRDWLELNDTDKIVFIWEWDLDKKGNKINQKIIIRRNENEFEHNKMDNG